VKQITAGDVTSGVGVRLDLQSEWNALLASVLTRRELGADAVDANVYGRVTTGVPYTLQRVNLTSVDLDVQQSVRQRYICTQFSLDH